MVRRLLILILALLVVWEYHQLPQGRQLEYAIVDLFDKRPAVKVLFIGNSRTFFNNMPFMVREIADSAHSPWKYRISMHAPGGVRLQDHWNNPQVQELLKQKWDYVVLQGRSNEQQNEWMNASFMYYGRKLADSAKANGATPVLFVMWRYSDADELYTKMPELKPYLHDLIQASYAALSVSTGASIVNVGKAREEVRRAEPQMCLYYDTNHPSVNGSYLCALLFYRFFSHDDLNHVTYVPRGVSQKDAELLKTAAQSR